MVGQWKWCVEKEDGTVAKGWYKDKENWYFLKDNGVMFTGWLQDKDGRWYYLNSNGIMQTGWLKDKEEWYYLEPNGTGYKGEMYCKGTYTIDGKSYTFDSRGKCIESLVTDTLMEFVKSYEGFRSKVYDDGTGVMTIGYGTTKKEYVNLGSCTKEQAIAWLKEEIEAMAKQIKKDLDNKKVYLKQNEFDSLCSFAYNCGVAALFGSTLYKNIIVGIKDSATIISNFQAWSNAGGRRIEGLYKRRTKESAIFLKGDYVGNV